MEQNPSPPTPVPPPKKSRKKLVGIITVVVVVVILVAVMGAIIIKPTVHVSAVDEIIFYNYGLTKGFLGPSSQSLPGFTTTAGGEAAYSITFTSSALSLTQSITSIYTATPGFSILSISPVLPYSLSPGSTVTITIIIRAPSYAYNGVLEITVWTS